MEQRSQELQLAGGRRLLEGGRSFGPPCVANMCSTGSCEQRAQPLRDLLARHAGAEPPLVDLEAPAEVDERVAGVRQRSYL